MISCPRLKDAQLRGDALQRQEFDSHYTDAAVAGKNWRCCNKATMFVRWGEE
jgi:hypothetical protein